MLLWQAFPFPISGEVYKVSYEKMLAKNLDTTQAQDLTHVVDTEAYYKSLTQDGTTTGAPHTSCTPWQALFPFALTPQQLRLGSNLRFDSVLVSMQQGHQRSQARTHRWPTSRCQAASGSTTSTPREWPLLSFWP